MLFKGNSSKLELLIEKIQANKEGSSEEAGSLANNEEVSVGVGSSWDVGSDGRGGSLSPASSRATPTSAGEVTDVEAAATLGVTSQTPYQCAFCDRAFPRLSYLKRHEQQSCSVSTKQSHRGDTSASTSALSVALNNDLACSTSSETEFKKDYTDSSTKSNVSVVWCTKPTILFNEGSFSRNVPKKIVNPVSCIPKYSESENMVVSNVANVSSSIVTTLSQPLDKKSNDKKLYCYTSAGLVSKPAVFSASLSTNFNKNNSYSNQLEAKVNSKGKSKDDSMQCIVSSMTDNTKKPEGKRKVSDYEVTEAVERVLKHKKDFVFKNSYKDNGNKFRKVEVCFPNSNKKKLNEKDLPLICDLASRNVTNEKDSANVKENLLTKFPLHSIVSLNSDSSISKPSKARPYTSSINQNVKSTTNKKILDVSMPQILVPLSSPFGEISVQKHKVITPKNDNDSNKDFSSSDEKFPYKISPNICMTSSYVMNNTLGYSSVQANKFKSAVKSTKDVNSPNPPIPNISISLVSMKPVSVPQVLETVKGIKSVSGSVMSKLVASKNQIVKGIPSDEISKNINDLPKTSVTVSFPVSMSINKIENSKNTEENDIEEDELNGQGNVWVEEKMYSFVKEELRQFGDPVPGAGEISNSKESMNQSKSDKIKKISVIEKDNPLSKDVSASTDSSGEIITEDVFSYIENELMRLDAMDDDDDNTGPLNTSSGDVFRERSSSLISTTSLDSSVNDSGFCPSGMRTPDSRKLSISSSVISADENWSFLSSKGSMDLHNITANSDNFLDETLNFERPLGRRSTFSEFNRPNKYIKPRLRRFSISDSHGTLNIERSPGAEPLLCLKDLDSLKTGKSDSLKGIETQIIEDSDPIEDISGAESCKVAEANSTLKSSDNDSLQLSLLENYKTVGQKLKLESNNDQENIDIEIQSKQKDKTNNISKDNAKIKVESSTNGKESIENFTKKRSMTEVDIKDVIDNIPKKSKILEQEHESIEIEKARAVNIEEEYNTVDIQMPSDVTKASTVISESIPKENMYFDLKECHLLKSGMNTKEISSMDSESMENSSDIHSIDSLRKTLNVKIPLTHVQLSRKHYDVMSPSSPISSNPEADTEKLSVNETFYDFLSSPILKKIDPSSYEFTPPCANMQKQNKSPVISPISPALPETGATYLPSIASPLPIILIKTPVSTITTITTTTATSITNAASAADVFVTPPSFHSSSSSTVTMEETPSPPASIGSDSPYENQLVSYQYMQSYQLNSNNSNIESLDNHGKSNDLNSNNSYGEYYNSYLKYLQPQCLSEKVSDPPSTSLYLTGNTLLHSNLHTIKEETGKKYEPLNTKGLFLPRMSNSNQESKDFISKLGVFTSKNDSAKDYLTSLDFQNATGDRKSHVVNSSVDIEQHSDSQFDEMEFPKRLKAFNFTKTSTSENNRERHESNVQNELTKMRFIQKTGYEMMNDELFNKVDENVEKDNDFDNKLPSVHIQVRTGALAEQRGKSRAILSKLSQPMIHVGHRRHCKVEPKVILIRTGLNSPGSSPTEDKTGKVDEISNRIFNDTYDDRKFSAEKLLYKANSPRSQYTENEENEFKFITKQNYNNNLIYPKYESLYQTNSNLISNTNLPEISNTKDNKLAIGMNRNEECAIEKTMKLNQDPESNNSDNEQADESLKKSPSNHINNSNVNLNNKNEWKDSKKSIITKNSLKKNKCKKVNEKEVLRKSSNEKEIFGEKQIMIKGLKITFTDDNSEKYSDNNNMKNIKKGKASFKENNVNKSGHGMIGKKEDFFPSHLLDEVDKAYANPLLETGKYSGAIDPDLGHVIDNTGTWSGKDFKEKKNVLVKSDAIEKTMKTVDVRSHGDTNDWKITNDHKDQLKNKEQSLFIPDNSYKSQSQSAVISTSNSKSIKNNSRPLISESHQFQDTWERDLDNVKCITKVIEGTAMIRAAIRNKKNLAARLKRNNLTKGKRKKDIKKKTTNGLKKTRNKSSLKENSNHKFISYSRDGEIFDPNNLSTASGDALMGGITVHCTPEGDVTLKLNCVENMDSNACKSGSSACVKLNKSNQENIITKSKENIVMTPSKELKCKDEYCETADASNKIPVDHSVNADIRKSSPVSSSTEVTKSDKESFSMHVESIDSYEETGNAITESVNPSKSVLELFEDFESLLGSMEDESNPEKKSKSNIKSDYPVSHPRAHGVKNTIALNGASSLSFGVDNTKSVAKNNLLTSTTMASTTTTMTRTTSNTESNTHVGQIYSDTCNRNTALSAANQSLNIMEKRNTNADFSNMKKQVDKYKIEVDISSKKSSKNKEIDKKNELSQPQVVSSKQENLHLENNSLKNRYSIKERNYPLNKSLTLPDRYNNRTGIHFASKEIQINYKIPKITKKCAFPISKNENYTNHSYSGKKSKRKNLFENKACQSNSNVNDVYSRNSIIQRERNSNFEDGKIKSKFCKRIEIDMKNRNNSKAYENVKDKNNNEFKHDHTYNCRRIKNKGKHKDSKVSSDPKIDCVIQNSNIKYNKDFFKTKPIINQREKMNAIKDQSLGSSFSNHATFSNKITSERELHTRESICTVYKENNVIAISKTSIMLNKNTKGKSNVPFEQETESLNRNSKGKLNVPLEHETESLNKNPKGKLNVPFKHETELLSKNTKGKSNIPFELENELLNKNTIGKSNVPFEHETESLNRNTKGKLNVPFKYETELLSKYSKGKSNGPFEHETESINRNAKGKLNLPFENETESSVKSAMCIDDLANNSKKIKAILQVEKTELDRKECPTNHEDMVSDEFTSGSYEKKIYIQNKFSLSDKTSVKSTESTPKVSNLRNEKGYHETKANFSIEADENKYNKCANEKYLSSPKQDLISNTDINDSPQSSPDSPHFGLIHKLAQTSANQGYTKIVVKKVRSSTIDKNKGQGLLTSTLKRNVATRTGDLTGIQLQVKNDLIPGKEFSSILKEKIFLTKRTALNESFIEDTNSTNDHSKPNLSKCDSGKDYGKESFEIKSTEEKTETIYKEFCNKSLNDKIDTNINNGMTPLENLEAMVDKHLPKDDENTEFEQKKFSFNDSYNGNENMSSMDGSFISMDDIITRDEDFDYSDLNKTILPMVHTFISTEDEHFEVGESHNFDSFSSNLAEHSNDYGGGNPAQINGRIMGNPQPLDLRLERSDVSFASEGTRLSGFSYSVDFKSGLVNVLSTEGPEFTGKISNSEVLGRNKEIRATNISATPTCISPIYAVQTVDNYTTAAIKDGPLIMPVYSVCESKALANSSQVMQIYSYNAEDFSIRDYESNSIYTNAASISSIASPNISIANTVRSEEGSLVVPIYSIASSNNINICNSESLAENTALLETSQTLQPVYLLNSFDSSNSLPCTQISTVYTSNIVDETINSFPSDHPVYGPQLIPIYSVETGNNLSNTAIGIRSLNSTSETREEIGNLHHLELSDISGNSSSGGDIILNIEYVENVTKSLKQNKNDTDLSVKNYQEKLDYYVQRDTTDISASISQESEHKNEVENIRESTIYDYVRNVTEIGNFDHPESSSEISNSECPENPLDAGGNLEYGDNIKSEPEDDEFSNTDFGGNHIGSEGGVCMDFLLLDSMTHADQLPFRCEFCGRLFKHKRSRDRHVKLHTGDKKYKCCHCEAAFSRSDHLKIHMKTHDTQKPYQCSVCNRGYNTAAALTAHMQNHKAKLTAHALNQLLKDAQDSPDANTLSALLKDSSQNPADAAALSQLLKEASSAHQPEGGHPLGHLLLRESPTDHHTLNHFMKDPPKEQLGSPRGVERGSTASPGGTSPSPGRENGSPASSPIAAVHCPICHVTCRNHTHLQRHISRHHSEDSGDRPASRGGSGTSSIGGGVSSTPSTPSPRPPSSLPSPRPPIPNPFMFLVGGKLSCIYCSRDGFLSLEALQMHIQSQHSSLLNGDSRDMANVLNLPSPLGSSLSAGGLNLNTLSPLGPSSSRGVTCELCGARVNGVTALQRHVVTAHTFTDLLARAAEGVFCAQCLLPFSNPGALAEHIKLVHASPVLSAVLNKRPPSPPNDAPTDLSKKTRRCDNSSDLPANTLLCSQCNAAFTNFEAFRRHLKTHLEGNDQVGSSLSGSQQLVCPECRLPLTSETALELHLATHLGATCTEYGCQACLKLFQKPDELQKHLMDIHAHHLYRCSLCKEMFDSKVSIQVHFAVKHSNECKVHKCTRCSLIFRTQSEFEAHVRSSHLRLPNGDGNGGSAIGNRNNSNGMYRCLLCTLSLSSESELAAHVSTHQRQFQCSLCDDAFHVEFLLDKHMQSAHNSELNGNVPQPENLAKSRRSPFKKDLKCDICDADFSSENSLLGHRKQAHNIKNISNNNNNNTKNAATALSLFCAYCSEACKSRIDLEIHMKSHQSSGGRHKCNICDELCPSAALLAQHKLSHIKVLSGNTCAVCREPLTTEHQLTSHQNEHHPAPLPQPCVVCRQTLVTDLELNVHARFHSLQAAQAQVNSVASSILSSSLQQAPMITTAATASHTNSDSNSQSSTSPRLSPKLRCPECNVKLETPDEAEAHAQVHQSQQKLSSSARTYQCIKCQESFASESEIEAHVASHLLHEGSSHECHLCRGTYDTPLRLQCHLIEHTFEGCGSFTCYMCSSVFTTAPRLQQHMVEHGLAARPYDCHHCHQKFFFRAELENHALSHTEATDGSCRECLANYPDLPRFHNRHPWPVLALVEATTAANRSLPARPTHNGSPQQTQLDGEEAPPSTNGHSDPDVDPLEEEELQP